MAKLTFGIVDPNLSMNVEINVADNDLPRIIGYLMTTSHGTVTDEGADEPRQATPQEAAASFAQGVLTGLLNQTVRHERDLAAKAAAEQIAEISVE